MKKRNLLCLLLAALLIAGCLPAAAETATEYPEKTSAASGPARTA